MPIQLKKENPVLDMYKKAGMLDYHTSLAGMLSADFDYAAFSKAIHADDMLDAKTKKRVLDTFDPKATVTICGIDPQGSITQMLSYALTGHKDTANSLVRQLPINKIASTELTARDPIAQMWKTVWEETLAHYALEAAEYEQEILSKGKSLMDDPSFYPVKAPPIYRLEHFGGTQAAIFPCPEPEKGKKMPRITLRALVSDDFTEKLTPKQQHAVLLHEAQHAIEPMLAGMEVRPHTIRSVLGRLGTLQYTTRKNEYRADEHSARMGYSDELQSALDALHADMAETVGAQKIILKHLMDNGFAFDGAMLTQDMMRGLASNQHLQISNLVPENITKVTNQLNELMEKGASINIGDKLRLLTGTSAEAEESGFRDKVKSTLKNRLKEAVLSHPSDAKRADKLAKAKICPACTTDSPHASHSERLKTISDTGIQGICASR